MINAIGVTSGKVWHLLNEKGDNTVSALSKEIKENDFLIAAALGWLAREGKIDITLKGKSKIVSLKK